jgi:hypothetical protein
MAQASKPVVHVFLQLDAKSSIVEKTLQQHLPELGHCCVRPLSRLRRRVDQRPSRCGAEHYAGAAATRKSIVPARAARGEKYRALLACFGQPALGYCGCVMGTPFLSQE